MRLTEACLFACLISSFAISTAIPLPPPQTVSALATRPSVEVRIIIFALDPQRVPENLQINVHVYGLDHMKGVPGQAEMDQYTDKVVLATKFALAAGAHVYAVPHPTPTTQTLSDGAFVKRLVQVQPLCKPREFVCIFTYPTMLAVGQYRNRIDEMRGSIASVNEAVVKVATVVKDEGDARYKTMHHSYNNDLWVFPEFQATDMADQSLIGEETKKMRKKRSNKAIRDLSTSSVLQVAGLVAQLVIKYPTETPATIKGRLLGKGLVQTWPSAPDRYFLEFPILEDSDVFRSIADQPTSPLNNEGHTSASGSSILSDPNFLLNSAKSPHASSSNTIQPGSSPHLDPDTISDAAFRVGMKRPGGHDDNFDRKRPKYNAL